MRNDDNIIYFNLEGFFLLGLLNHGDKLLILFVKFGQRERNVYITLCYFIMLHCICFVAVTLHKVTLSSSEIYPLPIAS